MRATEGINGVIIFTGVYRQTQERAANPTRILFSRSKKKKKKYHMTCLTIERQLERAPVILTTISECQSSPFLTQEADHSGSHLWVQSHPALKVILCKIGAC